jgi:phosphatidylglycerol---prolipoprotein diacylglyceryl transferase
VLPYISLPEIKLGPLPIHWFGILVAIAVLVGISLARWRAPKHDVDRDKLESLINWMLLSGFVLSHILDTIFYHPQEIIERPWSLLFIWEGLSSFGGFIGALVGILLWKKFRGKGESILRYCDLILSVFPVSWIIGRMGCAVVHDHKGKAVSEPNLLTVAFPDGPHYDLGLLEMFYAIFISAIVASFWGKKRPVGTYIGLTTLLYAPVRFVLDYLRATVGPTGDPRYFGFTPGQWASVGVFIFGVTFLVISLTRGRARPQTSAV